MSADPLPEPIHPAPARFKAGIISLSAALVMPPLAWSLQSLIGYGVSSRACYPGESLRLVPTFPQMEGILMAINVAALAICLLLMNRAYRNWSATRTERGGDLSQLIERGEGRTRFLAMLGILISAGFFIATIFTSIALLLSPLCQ